MKTNIIGGEILNNYNFLNFQRFGEVTPWLALVLDLLLFQVFNKLIPNVYDLNQVDMF